MKKQRAALVLHGFTATPECMLPLTDALQREGFLVEAPLLPGHGTDYRDLAQKTWQDWYGTAREAYQRLALECEEVCVTGLSMGGLLTLLLSAEFQVYRQAVLAAPVLFSGFMAEYVLPAVGKSFLKSIYPYHPKFVGGAINDPIARAKFVSYTKMPVKGMMQIVALQNEVKAKMEKIVAPTLIIHSPNDTVAPFSSVDYLEKHLGSKNIRKVLAQKSNHVITLDYDYPLVVSEVVSFFKE